MPNESVITRWSLLRWPVTDGPVVGSDQASFVSPVIVGMFRTEADAIGYRDLVAGAIATITLATDNEDGTVDLNHLGSVPVDSPDGVAPDYAYAIRQDRFLTNIDLSNVLDYQHQEYK